MVTTGVTKVARAVHPGQEIRVDSNKGKTVTMTVTKAEEAIPIQGHLLTTGSLY
jgi:hypothetical protein